VKVEKQIFTKYERARILGARALQISMDAPLLLKLTKEDLEKTRYDPLKIAELELDSGALPITVKRPFPEKREAKLKRERERIADEKVEEEEKKEEEEIAKEGEIMELANPDDESENDRDDNEGEEV
jgi:DNA-directed RNA polymerase subunit K/omega